MKRLKDNRHMLYVLKNANSKMRKAILQHADPDVIKTISEICYNTLHGNNKLHSRTRNRLRFYKSQIRSLASPKRSIRSKRNIIVKQYGGAFLPTLIGTVLTGVIGSILNKYAEQS